MGSLLSPNQDEDGDFLIILPFVRVRSNLFPFKKMGDWASLINLFLFTVCFILINI